MWDYSITIPSTLTGRTIRECWQFWLLPKRIQGQLRQQRRFTLNKQLVPVSQVVQSGDQLSMHFITTDFRTPTSNYLADSSANLAVLFENADLVVVNKAAGLKSHPNQPGERGTLLNHLAAYWACQTAAPYMVHRLDQQTSGAMIVAKNPVVVPILDRLISEKRIQRQYTAWVHGRFDQPTGQFTQPIGKDPTDKRKRWINTTDAQPAVTNYQVLKATTENTLVQLQLTTGRTHQLRVHLAANGHAIMGDPLYDSAAIQFSRLMLHATKLKLIIPFQMQAVSVEAPLPIIFLTDPANHK